MNANQVETLDALFSKIYDACEELEDFNEIVGDSRISKALEHFSAATDVLTVVLEANGGRGCSSSNRYNNERTLRPLRGKVWITKGEPGDGGKNLCVKFASGEFKVIAFLSNDQQADLLKAAESAVRAMGWDPAEWL